MRGVGEVVAEISGSEEEAPLGCCSFGGKTKMVNEETEEKEIEEEKKKAAAFNIAEGSLYHLLELRRESSFLWGKVFLWEKWKQNLEATLIQIVGMVGLTAEEQKRFADFDRELAETFMRISTLHDTDCCWDDYPHKLRPVCRHTGEILRLLSRQDMELSLIHI